MEQTPTAPKPPTSPHSADKAPSNYVKLQRGVRRLHEWEKRLQLDPNYVGEGDEYYHFVVHHRPKTRADCENVPRPCPFIGCRHNLWMDLTARRKDIKPRDPDRLPWEVEQSCVLDVVEKEGEVQQKQIAAFYKFSRERIRQIEAHLLYNICDDFQDFL